jgi:hypothetical protein
MHRTSPAPWGGDHGHLGMLMPTAAYTSISTGNVEYIFPDKPEIPFYSGSSRSTRDRQHAQYKLDLKEYEEAQTLRNPLKGLLIQATPESYREVLADTTIGYANVTPKDILQHMMDNYGEITEQDLQHNYETLKAPWDLDTTIAVVFIRGNQCCKFTEEGGDPIMDRFYIRALVTIFRNSGVMEDAV